jgi:glycosyltransferase involved in cell wall biosynthesis
MPFIDPNFNKDQFGVEGKTVLLTFGLLSPNKGIEYVIEALPAILEQYPNVMYIILGATHPNVIAREGESYRLKLGRLAKDRCVASHVIFYNRFVTLEELKEFIGAADISITPYLSVFAHFCTNADFRPSRISVHREHGHSRYSPFRNICVPSPAIPARIICERFSPTAWSSCFAPIPRMIGCGLSL